MTTLVEANSLSSLTYLAANPPQYPRNPTHVRHDPLVLYIARVPGSRDVFLTPMKPREKVVTAEDVTSSLYFLHIDQAEDTKLLERSADSEYPDSSGPEAQPDSKRSSIIARKPVLPGRPSLDDSRGSFDIPRKPPASVPQPLNASRRPAPLLPRGDAEQRQNIGQGLNPPPAYQAYNPSTNHMPLRNDPRSPNAFTGQDGFGMPSPQVRQPPSPTRTPAVSPGPRDLSDPFGGGGSGVSLTLIRRDPASGAQWNVAKIRDAPTTESAFAIHEGSGRQAGAPLQVDILTPGYSKFIQDIENKPTLIARGSGLSATSVDSTRSGASVSSHSHPRVFRRYVTMENSKRISNSFGHVRRDSRDMPSFADYRSSGEYSGRGSLDVGGPRTPGFDEFLATLPPTDSQLSPSEAGRDRTRAGFRGYTFQSPWSGRCEFVAGGMSLKCNHIIPVGSGASALPVAVTVSELRFNLPSAPVHSGSRSPGFSGSRSPEKDESKRHSLFARVRHGRNKSSSSESTFQAPPNPNNETDRLNLSLGQEHAGGGFGGKHVKLGKLIIDDEGLKMMDLIVATNLGLWFRAYERSEKQLRG